MEVQEIIRGGGFAPFDGQVLRIDGTCVRPYAVTDTRKLSVEVAEGAEGRLVLLHAAPVEAEIRLALAEGARLSVTEIFTAEAFVSLSVAEAAHSSCSLTMVQLASADLSFSAALDGREAGCDLRGVFLASGKEHCRVFVRIGHNVPDCRSDSLVKGIAGGEAKSEFRGLVYVAPDAQRTDARQQSRNIQLSRTARITTRPQLEIYADDVKCTHGATVGQMDADAIFYMRQRGLSEAQARALQIEGFVGDIVRRCDIEPLREALTEAVAAKLERM